MSLKRLLDKYLKRSKPSVVGLGVSQEGLSFALVTSEDGGPVLKACDMFLELEGSPSLESLKDTVQTLELEGSACRVSLSPNYYNLLLVEAPKVPSEELAEATRWKVKDLLPYPLEEALIDVFPLPADSSKGRNMVYAVSVREDEVRRIMDMVASLGLVLSSIDICELSLRNLVELDAQAERGACVVYLRQNRGLLTLMKGGCVYLSRQFEIAYNAGLFDDLPEEQLILELQRSLDYYERQMGQVPPATILIGGENVSDDKLSAGLKAAFNADVRCLSLPSVEGAETVDSAMLQLALPALGAALRKGED